MNFTFNHFSAVNEGFIALLKNMFNNQRVYGSDGKRYGLI